MGRLCMKGKLKPTAVPCTPKGCITLLERYNVDISGKNAVVIGRSNIVGIPAAHLLLERSTSFSRWYAGCLISSPPDLPAGTRP